jgi:O-antigen/teichoic acid export membrane protein
MSIHAAFARMLAARGVSLCITLAGFAALGRLLTPEDFGRFALAAAFFALARVVSGFGLQSYLVRERDLGADTAGRAMGLVLALSCATSAALLALAFWGPLHPGTAGALLVLAPAVIVVAAGTVAEALLSRRLDFRLIARLEVARAALDMGVAVALAWAGFGAVALASGMLASRVGGTAALLALGGHARALRPRLGGWRRFAGFGSRFSLVEVLPSGSGLVVNALITAFLGAASLGLYNRAEAIRTLLDRTLLEGIKPVVLPVLSRALDAGWSPADLHARKMDYLVAICWPAFALIALMAEPLVLVLLGPQWEAAITPVRILATIGVVVPVVKMSFKLFVATDHMDVLLRIAVTQHLIRVGLAFCGALISLEALCAALALSTMIRGARILAAARRLFGHGRPRSPAIVGRGAAVTAGALAGPAALLLWGGLGPFGTLALAAPAAAAGWLAALAATRHALLGEIGTALRPVLPRRRGGLEGQPGA